MTALLHIWSFIHLANTGVLHGRGEDYGIGGKHFDILVSSRILMTLKIFNFMPMCQEQKKAKRLWEKGGIQLDSLDETGIEGAVLYCPPMEY